MNDTCEDMNLPTWPN